MPRKKKVEEVEAPKSKAKEKTVTVINKDSKVVRVYSSIDHGKEYRELAKQFVGKSNKKFVNKLDQKYRIK